MNNLTGQQIADTYQYLLQTRDGGTTFYDGLGVTVSVVGMVGPQGPAGTDGVAGATGSQGLIGATGPQGIDGATGPQGPAGPGGGGSVAIPDTQIPFGNTAGTGLTSSYLLTFDDGNFIVEFEKPIDVGTIVCKHLELDATRHTQVLGDVDNGYGGTKLIVDNNTVTSHSVYSEGVVVTNSDIIFAGGGALDDLLITGSYNQLDSPTYTINTIPLPSSFITYTLTSGAITVETGEVITFDNAATGNLVFCNLTNQYAVLITSGDPSGASTWEVTTGVDLGATGTIDSIQNGDTFVLNCSSVLSGKFGIGGGILSPTINGITAALQNSVGHNGAENWTFDIIHTTVKGLNLDYSNNTFAMGDTTTNTARGLLFATTPNAIGFGGIADSKSIGVKTILDGTVTNINGIVMNYSAVEDSSPYSDILIGNDDLFNGTKLEIYEDTITNQLTYFNNIGDLWLNVGVTLGSSEDNSRAFALGDISGSYASTRIEIDDSAKNGSIKGRISSYPTRTTFTGVGLDDITIDGDYTGYLATDKFKVTILDTNIQFVRLLSGSAPGEINIGDNITCSPGDPGPSDATGKIIAFADPSDTLNGKVYVKVTSPDIFIGGSIFNNTSTGFFATIDSVSVLSDYVRYESSTTTEDYLLESSHYIAKGMDSAAASIIGHTTGDMWQFTVSTQKGTCLDIDYTTSKHTLGQGHFASLEVNTRSKSSNFIGGNSYEGKTVTGDTQIRENDRFIDISSLSPVIMTLPLISGLHYDHQVYTFTDYTGNAAANNISVVCQVGNTIRGTNNIRINANYGSVTLKSNKTTNSWMVISKTF